MHGFGHADKSADTGFPTLLACLFIEWLGAAPFGEEVGGGDRIFGPGGEDGFSDEGGVDIVAGVTPGFDALESGPVEEFFGGAVAQDLPGELFEMASQGIDEPELWLV